MTRFSFMIDEPGHKRWMLPDGKHYFNCVLLGDYFHSTIWNARTHQIVLSLPDVLIDGDNGQWKHLLEVQQELAEKKFRNKTRDEELRARMREISRDRSIKLLTRKKKPTFLRASKSAQTPYDRVEYHNSLPLRDMSKFIDGMDEAEYAARKKKEQLREQKLDEERANEEPRYTAKEWEALMNMATEKKRKEQEEERGEIAGHKTNADL